MLARGLVVLLHGLDGTQLGVDLLVDQELPAGQLEALFHDGAPGLDLLLLESHELVGLPLGAGLGVALERLELRHGTFHDGLQLPAAPCEQK